MFRRWRGYRARRGTYYGVPSSPVTPAWPPPLIRQSGTRPRFTRLRRGRYADPGLGQASQGIQFPLYMRQAGTRPRFTRAPRGRRFDPPWFPPPPVPPPQFLRPAGQLRFAARLLPSRRRRFDPGWGQANQGTAYPSFTRPAGPLRFAAKLRRGRFAEPPWAIPPQVPPQFLRPSGSLKFAARLLPSRRRRFDPGWGQGPQGQPWPSYMRQAGTRHRYPHVVSSHSRFSEPPWAQGFIPAPELDPRQLAGTIIADLMAGTISPDNYAGVIT